MRLANLARYLLLAALLLGACAPKATPSPTAAPLLAAEENVLYLSLVWHQHQPLYYQEPAGVYTRPWVRAHATKDYYDMASTVAQYPKVHVTFNLTPVLLRQLEDFAGGGAKDTYWVLAEKPADSLTEEDKRFLLTRFFDANYTNIIGHFPRYQELLNKRGGNTDEEIDRALTTFDETDYRDLQVWFNLAWFDPDFLAQPPLQSLVEKGKGFSEEDKVVVFDEARRIIREIIPLHRQLQDAGQIEVTTTPYAHPILPLIYNTKLALIGNPDAEMPQRFSYPNDAIAQLEIAADQYRQWFGREPRGLWPAEGAVAEDIVPLVANAGFRWMASGEQVLAQSLGIVAFTRNSRDTVQEADALYRPYFVQGDRGDPVMMIFRDLRLSDLIGFEYSQTPGEEAAADFMQRLEDIRQELDVENAQGPHLVSVILDGENAWENYPNDGKTFLNALYQQLSESKTVRTVTPSEYLKMFPEQRTLETLFPGAWFSPNFDTWIGEPEETTAWGYLLKTRKDLAKYDLTEDKVAPSPEALQQALDFMYLAEGSDWFWWYGADQNSGNDDYFDRGFRALLTSVYVSLGEEPPPFLQVPIIATTPAAAMQGLQAPFTPTLDGAVSPETEWNQAAVYSAAGGVQARAADLASSLSLALDSQNLYLRLALDPEVWTLEEPRATIFLASPRLKETGSFRTTPVSGTEPELIGFPAVARLDLLLRRPRPEAAWSTAVGGAWGPSAARTDIQVAAGTGGVEIAIPLTLLGEVEAGDELRFLAVVADGVRSLQDLPADGPASLILPDLGNAQIVLKIEDPAGDDTGPGNYTYPTDGIFKPQVFDLRAFTVAADERNITFTFELYGPLTNPWGSPNNLALQTLDVYVDTDPGQSTGARMLLPGRNAALAEGFGWEAAVWAEGWTPQFLRPDASGTPIQDSKVRFKVISDVAGQKVSLRVPRQAFGEGDPSTWAYAGVLLSQEGFPSPGVWRVRDVEAEASQWRIGGGSADTNHTRILDIAWPEGTEITQQQMLSSYQPSTEAVDTLVPEMLAQLQMLRP
jgi:alpha-amylase/alpha-mannosidase (GH57 family)